MKRLVAALVLAVSRGSLADDVECVALVPAPSKSSVVVWRGPHGPEPVVVLSESQARLTAGKLVTCNTELERARMEADRTLISWKVWLIAGFILGAFGGYGAARLTH